MRVLLVEDDRMIGESVQNELRDGGYAVDWVRDGKLALTTLNTHVYDAILLDLGLPGADGFAVLRAVRSGANHVPLIIVTARDSVDERIRGLDEGADDYLIKPFDISELKARMRAVIRRRGGQAAPIMSNGVLTLDPATREATSGDIAIRLSSREFALLQALMIRPGAILSRAEIEDRIYGWNEEVESNAVEFLIHSLRKKLGATAIKNVRGVGWMVSKQP
ncbi:MULTISPECIES: response regulator transcription factor [Caballeronia]|jgi:two-component system OmpR family response regulator|uniref:XRE family transcriptional regulator n=1 Tax=Caballeronia zhejiangensis TaxID=871203 RepID=A0A656QJC7_9BURK|nr:MULTISPECIES: response regulator transcription factor [Caballeronia]EKS69455.1 transcriptional regulator [Burkholderia sp. SJ98]KDR29675.1 XRE family transcriptional regulator [Caballeronia zhejiangensis]MCG7401709.1 response regulator transcription factor [Caballeronia zhejiangensis]MCI1045279.1 response regulator transcription factor [Caballeronia zhejiangensis]MDR5767044.1 response regulator transcription factor [Caballeronia sp. LZ028]